LENEIPDLEKYERNFNEIDLRIAAGDIELNSAGSINTSV